MKRVLIINLGDSKSIVSSGALISKMSRDGRFGAISMLIFEEYRSSALVLNNVEKIITMDRETIQSLFNSKIYPKHFSLNAFMSKIDLIDNSNFDLVVNYSGDKAASYLLGYFSSNSEICGSYYSSKNNLCHTDEWSIVNEVAEEISCLTFCRNEIYGKMMNLKFDQSHDGYVVREKHEKTVVHSLNKLKRLNQYGGKSPKIIGFCVGAGKRFKSIPIKTIIDLLREMRSHKEFLPLVVVGVNSEDENVAKMLNERFGYSLTLVKMDIVAAPSLLKGLDALVCPDGYFKSLAELVGTQVVELSLGQMSMRGGVDGSIVVTASKNNSFYKDSDDMQIVRGQGFLKASDIMKVFLHAFDDKRSSKLHLDSDIDVYRRAGQDGEIFYEKINEGREGVLSIHRVMTRNAIMLRFYQPDDFDKKLPYLLHHNSRESLNHWINSERKLIADMMKDILSVVRLILQSQKDKGKAKELAYKFDNLFSYEKINSPARIPIVFLRGLIFSVDKVDFILEEIYKTKGHLQKYNALVEDLDGHQRKGRFVKKSKKAPEAVNV